MRRSVGLSWKGYEGAEIYTGYASEDWLRCNAVAQIFRSVYAFSNFIPNGRDTHAYVINARLFFNRQTYKYIRFSVLHS